MSCFVVPLTEAVVVSAAKALINRRNNAKNVVNESQKSKLKLESFNKKISIDSLQKYPILSYELDTICNDYNSCFSTEYR